MRRCDHCGRSIGEQERAHGGVHAEGFEVRSIILCDTSKHPCHALVTSGQEPLGTGNPDGPRRQTKKKPPRRMSETYKRAPFDARSPEAIFAAYGVWPEERADIAEDEYGTRSKKGGRETQRKADPSV